MADADVDVRIAAATALVVHWQSEKMIQLLFDIAAQDENPNTRDAALVGLASYVYNEAIRELVVRRMTAGDDSVLHCTFVGVLASGWRDTRTKDLLLDWAAHDLPATVRGQAIRDLHCWPDEEEIQYFLLKRAKVETSPKVRGRIAGELARGWKNELTRTALLEIAVGDKNEEVRRIAFNEAVAIWPDLVPRGIVLDDRANDYDAIIARLAQEALSPELRTDRENRAHE
jgi:hypothetical protein